MSRSGQQVISSDPGSAYGARTGSAAKSRYLSSREKRDVAVTAVEGLRGKNLVATPMSRSDTGRTRGAVAQSTATLKPDPGEMARPDGGRKRHTRRARRRTDRQAKMIHEDAPQKEAGSCSTSGD